MLTGRYEAIPGSGQLTTLSGAESMAATFKADYMAPFLLIPGMEKEKREQLQNRITALRFEAEDRGQPQGMMQRGANWVAGLAGSILNPISLATGEGAGVAARMAIPRVGMLTGKYLPSQVNALVTRPLSEMVGNRLPQFVGKETLGSLSGKGVSGYAQATGFSLPGEIANTYDAEGDSFNWYGGIKASFEDGGLGLLLMSAPYLGGIVWGKLFRGAADHSAMPTPGEPFDLSQIDKAVQDKRLSPHEGQWFKDYLSQADTHENLSQRATAMLIRDGHPVSSSTNQVLFKILHPDDVGNLQTGVADQLAASELPQNMKQLLNDYILRNRMDGLRENPTSVMDGLSGVVRFVRKGLERAPEDRVRFQKIVRRLLPERVKEENPLTQNKLFNAHKRGESSGLAIPRQVERRIKQQNKINQLKQKVSSYQKLFEKTKKVKYQNLIALNEKKIEAASAKLEPLLSHADEMKSLRQELLPEGKALENFKGSKSYHRLLDLTRVRNDARQLMHELHLTHEHELHDAYATMLDTITKVMRSEFGKLAKVEDVNNYMRERIQGRAPEFKALEIKETQAEVKVASEKAAAARGELKTPEGRDAALKMLDEEMKETRASELKEEYQEVKNQYDEFKNSESVFSNLIKCVLGGMGA